MKFNNCLLILVLFMMTACSFPFDKKIFIKSKPVKTSKAPLVINKSTSSSILPDGPVTPNPYLQSKPKLSEQVEFNFQDAIFAIQQKNWNHAESVLQSLAKTNPDLSGVQLNLGIVYQAKGDNAKAEDAFNRAIRVNPRNVDAYNQLAVLKRQAGQFNEAEMLYKKALDTWPFYPAGHKNIAILYELYLGKPELALPHYKAYQQLLIVPDKQVDSWIADLERRLNGGKAPAKQAEAVGTKTDAPAEKTETPAEKAEAK